jgi:hypothetical protein
MTKEQLISEGFKTYQEGKKSEAYFYVSEIKKQYPDSVIEDADVKTFEIKGKKVKCVLLRNVKF